MAKKDKKRKKPYTKKHVRVPAYLSPYLPEYSEKALINLELAELLPLKAVKNGDGTQYNLLSLAATLKVGALIERFYDAGILDLCMIAQAGLHVAQEFVKKKIPVPEELIAPTEDAVTQIIAIQRQLSRPAMDVLLEEGQKKTLQILDYKEESVRHIIPGKSPKATIPEGEVLTYLEGEPCRGRLLCEGEELVFVRGEERLTMEKPIVAYAL